MTTAADTRDVVGWVAERRQALQIGGALLAVAVLLLFNVSWGWFLALVVLLAAWELRGHRGDRHSGPARPTGARRQPAG